MGLPGARARNSHEPSREVVWLRTRLCLLSTAAGGMPSKRCVRRFAVVGVFAACVGCFVAGFLRFPLRAPVHPTVERVVEEAGEHFIQRTHVEGSVGLEEMEAALEEMHLAVVQALQFPQVNVSDDGDFGDTLGHIFNIYSSTGSRHLDDARIVETTAFACIGFLLYTTCLGTAATLFFLLSRWAFDRMYESVPVKRAEWDRLLLEHRRNVELRRKRALVQEPLFDVDSEPAHRHLEYEGPYAGYRAAASVSIHRILASHEVVCLHLPGVLFVPVGVVLAVLVSFVFWPLFSLDSLDAGLTEAFHGILTISAPRGEIGRQSHWYQTVVSVPLLVLGQFVFLVAIWRVCTDILSAFRWTSFRNGVRTEW